MRTISFSLDVSWFEIKRMARSISEWLSCLLLPRPRIVWKRLPRIAPELQMGDVVLYRAVGNIMDRDISLSLKTRVAHSNRNLSNTNLLLLEREREGVCVSVCKMPQLVSSWWIFVDGNPKRENHVVIDLHYSSVLDVHVGWWWRSKKPIIIKSLDCVFNYMSCA